MADHPTLAAALADLQTQLPHIGKTAEAQYGKYANLTDVSDELLPLMGKLGLSFSAKATMVGEEFGLLYKLRIAGSDEVDEGFWPLPKGTPQQVGSAITYYRRYLLCSLTGVAPADGDDDGHEAGKAKPPTRTRAKVTGAEHERLRNGTVERTPDDPPAERHRSDPGTDQWTDSPPGTFDASLVEPEDRPGSSDSGQLKKIHAKLTALGLTDRDKGLTVIEQIIGHPLAGPHRAPDESDRTSKNLSWQDAEKVNKELSARVLKQEKVAAGA